MQHSVVHFECSESSGSWSYNGEGTTECFNGETQGENNNGKMVNSMAGQGFRQPGVSLAFFTGLVFACSAPSTVPCANVCHMVAPS